MSAYVLGTVLSPMWRIVMFLDENNIIQDRSKHKLIYFDKNKFSSPVSKILNYLWEKSLLLICKLFFFYCRILSLINLVQILMNHCFL